MAAPANENVSWSEDDGVGGPCTWSDGDEIDEDDSGRIVKVDDVGGGHGDGGMF